jgi:hypothetical protein
MNRLSKHWWIAALVVALLLALLSPLASPHPDGLERVAEDDGFIDRAQEAPYEVIPDYLFPGIENERLATIAAGVVGTLVTFGLGSGLAWVLRRRSDRPVS